jgi:hypothetical protein
MSRRCAVAIAFATLCVPGYASAQPAASQVSAEALFQEGKRLLEAQAYAEACPKLAESYRLDPATGTLLALALCHEKANRLATAWATYTDTAARAAQDGNAAREKAARDRAQALAGRTSKLTITVAPELQATAGLTVKRGGVLVGASSFGTQVPVDGGEHVIEASAPGRKPFRATVRVRDEGDAQSVAVGPLEALPAKGAPEEPSRGLGPLQMGGVVAASAGVLAIGIGTGFAVHAAAKDSASKENGLCSPDNRCGAQGTALRNSALAAADVSTGLFVAGGVLAAGGVALFVFGRRSGASPPSVQTAPVVGPGMGGFAMTGRF